MQIVLEVIKGPHRGRTFTFDGHDNFIVGRAPCAHFRLPKEDTYFSRVHFMIEANPPQCRLVDMGSTNGTALNRRRVESAELQDGDFIQGGDTVLKVSFIYEPSETPDTSPAPFAAPVPTETAVDAPTAPPVPAVPGDPPRPELETTKTYQSDVPELSAGPVDAIAGPGGVIQAIEGYEILCELGRGGMGTVFRAKRLADGSDVALKTIQPAVAGSERQVQRFLREAAILRKLRHPNIVSFHDMGQAGELLYFTMDYVPGTDAARLLEYDGPLEIDRAVRLICDVLEALHYAHAQGFVHRDVKPANLLVSGDPGFETCKLADFGLARVYHASPLSGLTLMGDAGGTLPYMPPEQITDYRESSPPADQYATAATLYRLLTGHYLYDFEELPRQQRLTRILLDEPVPVRDRRPDVPTALAQTIHRALDKDPATRFPDAAGFRDALLRFAGCE
jgi:serine/threonine-protein kinase